MKIGNSEILRILFREFTIFFQGPGRAASEASRPTDQKLAFLLLKSVKKSLRKNLSKNRSKNAKSVKKFVEKFKKCKKLQNLPGLPGNRKSVPPSHIVRIYPRLTSTKSVLRQASTRLARAEILKSLLDLLATYFKNEKLSASNFEFEFAVG